MADSLTEMEIDEVKTHYCQLLKEDEKTMSASMVPTLLRYLGQNPTEADAKEIQDIVDTEYNGHIDFDPFLELWVRKKKTKPELTESLREAFRYFDKDDKGFVEAQELRKTLTDIGDKMSESEMDELCREAGVNKSGKLEYEEFIKVIMSTNSQHIL